MNTARKQAMAFFATLIKHAQEDEDPELSSTDDPRGPGQRYFEGSMTGAGTGMLAGGALGGLIGGYKGYQETKPNAFGRNDKRLKHVLLKILRGVVGGSLGGAAIGGVAGGAGEYLGGKRRQPKRPLKAGPRKIGQRYFEGSMTGAGPGLLMGSGLGGLLGGLKAFNESNNIAPENRRKEILKGVLRYAALGGLGGGAIGSAVGAGSGVLFGSRKQRPTF